jgi:hypothetical protein
VESEAAAVPGYVNRPAGRAPESRRSVAAGARRTGRRQRMRITLVALRAYEQRAECRARMQAWLLTRATAGPARG